MFKTDLIQQLRKTTSLPSLPQVVMKVSELASKPNTSASDIARFMEHDISLTAMLLKVANSAAFGGTAKINSVTQAIARLGMREVTNICITLSVIKGMKVFKEIDCARFWKHCISVGYASQLISDLSSNPSFKLSKELLFTAGLLHDIGIVIFLTIARDEWLKAIHEAAMNKEDKALWEVERKKFGTDHAELGSILLRQWKLPEEIALSTELHHYDKGFSEDNPLSYIIRFGNFICNNQGLEHGILEKDERFTQEMWNASGLVADTVPRIIAEVNSRAAKSDLLTTVGIGKAK